MRTIVLLDFVHNTCSYTIATLQTDLNFAYGIEPNLYRNVYIRKVVTDQFAGPFNSTKEACEAIRLNVFPDSVRDVMVEYGQDVGNIIQVNFAKRRRNNVFKYSTLVQSF